MKAVEEIAVARYRHHLRLDLQSRRVPRQPSWRVRPETPLVKSTVPNLTRSKIEDAKNLTQGQLDRRQRPAVPDELGVVTALITNDGCLYVGAVDQNVLITAAAQRK